MFLNRNFVLLLALTCCLTSDIARGDYFLTKSDDSCDISEVEQVASDEFPREEVNLASVLSALKISAKNFFDTHFPGVDITEDSEERYIVIGSVTIDLTRKDVVAKTACFLRRVYKKFGTLGLTGAVFLTPFVSGFMKSMGGLVGKIVARGALPKSGASDDESNESSSAASTKPRRRYFRNFVLMVVALVLSFWIIARWLDTADPKYRDHRFSQASNVDLSSPL